jgi:hypothetical protein
VFNTSNNVLSNQIPAFLSFIKLGRTCLGIYKHSSLMKNNKEGFVSSGLGVSKNFDAMNGSVSTSLMFGLTAGILSFFSSYEATSSSSSPSSCSLLSCSRS